MHWQLPERRLRSRHPLRFDMDRWREMSVVIPPDYHYDGQMFGVLHERSVFVAINVGLGVLQVSGAISLESPFQLLELWRCWLSEKEEID